MLMASLLLTGLVVAIFFGMISGLMIGGKAIGNEVAGGLGGIYGFIGGGGALILGLVILKSLQPLI